MRHAAAWVLLVAAAEPASAAGQRLEVDLPAGSLGAAVGRLAQQVAVSISIDDPVLPRRQVARVRGRMTAAAAVRILARHAGADATRIGGSNWRLTIARKGARVPVPRPPAVPPVQARSDAEIVVLASKRGVPLAALASSVDILATPAIGIEAGSSALVTRSTILSTTYRGQGRDKLFLRGIADSSFASRLQSVTGLYFGDLRLTYSAADPSLQLYDMASVELLQGPQGTLYGSGSMAGVIRLNPNMPERDDIGGSVGAGISTVSNGATGGDADALLNLPLTGNVAVRLLGYARSEGGFIDKPALGPDVNRLHVEGGRAIVRWWPRDGWTVDAIAMRQSIDMRDNQYATAGAAPLVNLDTVAEPLRGDYTAGHAVVNGRVGHIVLVSATGIARQRSYERSIGSRSGIADVERKHALFTHEMRLSGGGDDGIGWVAGLSYVDAEDEAFARPSIASFGLTQTVETSVTEAALFAEGTVRLAPFLSVGGGARFVQARAAIRQTSVAGLFSAGTFERRSQRWLLPTASLLMRPTRTVSAYVRYQQGRRADVAALPPGLAGLIDVADLPPGERISSIDAGVRWQSDRGGHAAFSFQHSDWRALRADFFEPFTGFILGSLGDWTLSSVHARLTWPVTQRLWLDIAATRNRNRPALAPLRAADLRLPDIADVIARGAVNWTVPLGARTVVHGEGWVRYEGPIDTNTLLFRSRMARGHARVGLNLDVRRGKDALILSVDNVLDARGPRYLAGSASRAGSTTTPLQPRTLRLGYRRSFK